MSDWVIFLNGRLRVVCDDNWGWFLPRGVDVWRVGFEVSEFDVVNGFIACLKPFLGVEFRISNREIVSLH